MGGPPPDWWAYFVAAKACNSQPWIVAGLPHTAGMRCWVEWALMREAAMANAEEELARKREVMNRMRGRR